MIDTVHVLVLEGDIPWGETEDKNIGVFATAEAAEAYCGANAIDKYGVEIDYRIEVFPLGA